METSRSNRRYALVASTVGTTLEVYDFFIYGTAAALVFSTQFFPSLDPAAGLLAAFLTYAVGYVARPLGALIFGHFGDRIGRKSTLLVTMLLMAVPTVLIGCLPNYEQIGLAAPIILCVLRILQGVAYGGEWGGAVLLAVETAPRGRKSFFGSLPSAGAAAGLVLSTVAWAATSRLPEADFQQWGWRLPFVASVVLMAVGIFVRLKVEETPDYRQTRSAGQIPRAPILDVFRTAKASMLWCIGARVFENSWFSIVLVFLVGYAVSAAGISKMEVLNAIALGAAVSVPTLLLVGLLGDRVGQKVLYTAGAIALAAWTWTMFDLVRDGQAKLALVVGLGLIWPFVYGPQAALFAAQFDARIRYTALSVATQLAGILAGAIAPLIATVLMNRANGSTLPIEIYLTVLALAGLASTYFMKPHQVLDEPAAPVQTTAARAAVVSTSA